jgi:hypothetical protein
LAVPKSGHLAQRLHESSEQSKKACNACCKPLMYQRILVGSAV